ncbi:AEC family transporter [Ramlibacter sp. MAHUQ-53]|uniref:AEC family transporter n=1 Tax=unclassified Ramlibacter TaxID=2617605 RepID=UPI003626DE38
MLDILKVTFPFFALVLCGYLAARRRMLPLEAIGGLNTFVLFFSLPCMLYRFGASMPVARLFDPAVVAVWLPCALLMVAGAVRFSLNGRIRWNDASFGALVAAFPNTGFMGVPLLVALLGPRAAGPTIAALLVDMVITSSLCIALSRLDGAGQGGAAAAARKALRGVFLNPLPWAILLGGLSSALGLEPYKPLGATIGLLADAASPVALFTIGAVLARSQMVAAARGDAAMPWRDFVPVSLAKLVLHPLLVAGAAWGARALGLPLDPFAATVLVLVAALPSASNVSVLAERFGADTGRIARIILLTTAAAFLSFSAAVALVT